MIVPLILVILIDIYAFQAVRTVFESSPWFRNPAVLTYWSISLIIYILIAIAIFSFFSLNPMMKRIVLGAVICIGVAKLVMVSFLMVDDVVRLGKFGFSLASSPAADEAVSKGISRSQFLSQGALLAGGVMFGLFTWGMIRTAYQFTVRRHTLKFPSLPEGFKGMKIVQISDAHVGSFLNSDPVKTAVKMINEIEPDVVFFTGDLVNSTSKEAEPFIEAFSQIKAKYGVFSVLGNHDYGYYHRWDNEQDKIDNMTRFYEIHEECGWTLLKNENRILDVDGAQIAVIGVENWGASEHFPKAGDLKKAKAGTDGAHVKLLLSHDPSHWDYHVSKEDPDIDVTFSGHTHGFQMGIEIPWLKIKWSPSQYAYKQWAGLYQKGKQHLYVNRGLGFIGYHGRVGILPEITVMEIEKA